MSKNNLGKLYTCLFGLFVCSVLFVSCVSREEQVREQGNDLITARLPDGCEYFANRSYGSNYVFTHKGSCDNPVHVRYLPKHDTIRVIVYDTTFESR